MKKMIKTLLTLTIITIIISILIYIYVINNNNLKKYEKNQIQQNTFDCILILGAGVRGDNPSPMLEDRLQTGIYLYNKNIAKKIIVSGDHGKEYYDEVNVMKNFLIENGIPDSDIFMDHAGFSTYDSIYRAKNIFNVRNIVIVTQKYHLHRSLYIAKKLKLNAVGVFADDKKYSNQIKRDIREFFAIVKDFLKCIFKPKSKFLGEIIPVVGNGNITNDK